MTSEKKEVNRFCATAAVIEEPLSVLNGTMRDKKEVKKIDFDPWFKESIIRKEYTAYYKKEKELGKGATSIVYNVIDTRTGHSFASKEISKNIDKKIVRTEAAILLKAFHPNIIRLHQIFETKKKVIFILEKVTGGELFDRIVERGCYTELDAINCLKQILSAIKFLHKMNIVHRDLKPENLLYANDSSEALIKVADFGLSKESGQAMLTICGTPGYVAPEIILGKPYNSAIDIWSVGVIAYILLAGYEPFYDERGDTHIFRKIIKGDFEFHSPWWDDVSDEAKDFVSKLLKLDPLKRLSADQALEHPWILSAETMTEARGRRQLNVEDNMRQYIARRKMKAAIRVVQWSRQNLFSTSNAGPPGHPANKSSQAQGSAGRGTMDMSKLQSTMPKVASKSVNDTSAIQDK